MIRKLLNGPPIPSGASPDPADAALSRKEAELNRRLLRWKEEYRSSCGGDIPYDMPVLTDERIRKSRLYRFCGVLPKGADLHIHGMTLLPFEQRLSFVKSRKDLYIGTGEARRYVLACHESPKDAGKGELPLQEALDCGAIGYEELKEQWTALGGKRHDDIWEWFERLFFRHSAMSATPGLIEAYYREAFRYCAESNILHLEIRQLFPGTHQEAAANAIAIRNAYYAVKKEHPGFIASLVGTGLKYSLLAKAYTDTLLDNAIYIHKTIRDESDPDHVHDFLVAVDLVNEEDRSRPLAEFVDRLKAITGECPSLHPVLHAGETLRDCPDNLMSAYRSGARRIGHGLNLIKFPEIMELFRGDGICLEVCPISNQTLRYVKDLRNHPAADYLRRGLPVCLGSDDPAYQEVNTLTDDFFAAIICWDLDVADIRRLCKNSIRYSCVDDLQKRELLNCWKKQWEAFLDFGG